MKKSIPSLLVVTLLAASLVAHADDMKGMPMKDMPMKDMPMNTQSQWQTHRADGAVKELDAAKGTVTITHGPVKSLTWPAMIMSYRVRDKMLLDKLTVGQKVDFEFVQEGSDYVVTQIK